MPLLLTVPGRLINLISGEKSQHFHSVLQIVLRWHTTFSFFFKETHIQVEHRSCLLLELGENEQAACYFLSQWNCCVRRAKRNVSKRLTTSLSISWKYWCVSIETLSHFSLKWERKQNKTLKINTEGICDTHKGSSTPRFTCIMMHYAIFVKHCATGSIIVIAKLTVVSPTYFNSGCHFVTCWWNMTRLIFLITSFGSRSPSRCHGRGGFASFSEVLRKTENRHDEKTPIFSLSAALCLLVIVTVSAG